MSNTQHAKISAPVVPAGDFGIGLCLQCLGEIIARGNEAPPPNFGITFAPMPFPAGQPPKRPLLVANGSL